MTVEPILFCSDSSVLEGLTGAGDPTQRPGAVVVDWESRGKCERQAGSTGRIGTDTDLRVDSPQDLARVRALVDLPVICRINPPSPSTPDEVDLAIELGADEVLVPMLRSPADLDEVLHAVGGRAATGIMIETLEAVRDAPILGTYPIVRAYVGLMDLALERRTPSVFTSLVDGTVDEVVSRLGSVPYGFGGMTLPGRGHPLPSRLLAGEIVRAGCSFSFMRRSFRGDLGTGDPGPAIAAIRQMVEELDARGAAEVAAERREFVAQVAAFEAGTL